MGKTKQQESINSFKVWRVNFSYIKFNHEAETYGGVIKAETFIVSQDDYLQIEKIAKKRFKNMIEKDEDIKNQELKNKIVDSFHAMKTILICVDNGLCKVTSESYA